MSDNVTPAAATPAATPAPNPVSEAGRTLAQARAEHRNAINAKPAPAPAPAAETPAANDHDDELAQLIAADRRNKTKEQELTAREAAIKEHETLLPVVKSVKEHLAKGERLAAVQALMPGEDLTTDFFWEVAKAAEAKAEAGGEAIDIPKAVAAEIEKRQAAEREAAENKTRAERQAVADALSAADAKTGEGFGRTVVEVMELAKAPPEEVARVTEAFAEFANAVDDTYDAHIAQFPAITELKPPPGEIVRAAEKLRRAHPQRQVPSPLEVLQVIEGELRARARRAAGLEAQAEPARTAPVVTSDWRSDAGKPAPEEKAPQTLDERREAHRDALRKRSAGSAA